MSQPALQGRLRIPGLLLLALFWRHLTRHRLRSALTLLGVALGVAVAVAVQLANGTALDAFARTTRAVAGPAVWQVVQPGGEVPQTLVPRLRPLVDLAVLSPVLEAAAVTADAARRPLRLVGVDLLAPGAFRGYAQAAAGGVRAAPALDQGWPNGLWITQEAARKLALSEGRRLGVLVNDRRVDLPVLGVLPGGPDTAGLDPWIAFLDVAALQELTGRTASLDRIDLTPREGVTAAELRQAFEGLRLPGVSLADPADATRSAERMLASFRMNLMALSFVALVVGAYLIYNAVSISVVQRRREVAMMRAVGALRRQIFGIFALEAVLVGSLGGLLGLGLGSVLARGAVAAVSQTVDALYVDTSAQAVAWDPLPFAIGWVAGVTLSLVAALAPALEAAGTSPALAMRAGSWEARQRGRSGRWALVGVGLVALAAAAASVPAHGGPPWGGYLAAALLVLGTSFWAPLTVEGLSWAVERLTAGGRLSAPVLLGVRNFRRAVGRNGVAVAALMVGAAMTVGVATMVGSFRGTVTAWIETTLPGAYYVNPAAAGTTSGFGAIATLDPSLPAILRRVPGVVDVEAFRERVLPYAGVAIRLGGADMDVLARHGSMVLRDPGDPRGLFAACVGTDRVLVSEALSIKHGVDPGEDLLLPTPLGVRPFRVLAVYHDYSSDQGYVLMDRQTYQRWWRDDAITDIAVYAAPETDREALRGHLQTALGARPVTLVASEAVRQQVMKVFDDTFAITYALHAVSITVSLLGVAGTLAALVLERSREIAIQRQIGLLRRQVAAMVMTEAGLIGLAGAGLGLLGGGMLALLLIEVINRQSFGWSVGFAIPWGFVAGTVAAVVGAAVLAGWLPAHSAARARLAEAMRDE
ncbi:MAG: ABC transporter permease [Candidatus Sericytochromatia bacterium]|nr:ABC transporter permease [Candidatus Sericytochromatia bacterium]